jgi:cytoskeletal protein CcmA (bactofilin family)/predicted RNA-binding Zn-ribbon protein involved in translation (DUF1610 family)
VPAAKQNTVKVTCPKCGHEQAEPRGAYSSACRKCQAYFRLEDALRPAVRPDAPAIARKQIDCFECGASLEVPLAAESTLCKKCGRHVDLADYRITSTVSKNFRTYGKLVLEEKGYILNTDSRVGEAVLKGRFIGKIETVRTLELHSSASIKGSFKAGCLVIPAGHHIRWPVAAQTGGAEIGGEWVGELHSTGTVRLKPSARFFGHLVTASLVMDPGAVFVGTAEIDPVKTSATPARTPKAPTKNPGIAPGVG